MSYYVDCFKSYEAEIAGLKERNSELLAALELKTSGELLDDIMWLEERNANLVAALEVARVYIAEDDDAESKKLLQQIRTALQQNRRET